MPTAVLPVPATHTRRNALTLITGGCLALASWQSAAAMDISKASMGSAFVLGDKISLAALLSKQGPKAEITGKYLLQGKKVAELLGVKFTPFARPGGDSAQADAAMVHYLIEGDGAQIGVALGKKYDASHGSLFEIAVKSNLLLLLYAPGDSMSTMIAESIESRSKILALPPELWSDLVSKVANKGTQEEVSSAVFVMHKSIANYYVPGTYE